MPFSPIRITCKADKIFDPSAKECVPGNQESCEFGEITTVPTTTPGEPSLSEICRGVFFAARPYPPLMTSYVGCIRGEGTVRECFSDEYFEPSLNVCMPASTTPEPTTTTTESTTTTTTLFPITPTPPIDGLCEGIENGYVSYPNDCSLYIRCIAGSEANILQCKPAEIFDVEAQK